MTDLKLISLCDMWHHPMTRSSTVDTRNPPANLLSFRHPFPEMREREEQKIVFVVINSHLQKIPSEYKIIQEHLILWPWYNVTWRRFCLQLISLTGTSLTNYFGTSLKRQQRKVDSTPLFSEQQHQRKLEIPTDPDSNWFSPNSKRNPRESNTFKMIPHRSILRRNWKSRSESEIYDFFM